MSFAAIQSGKKTMMARRNILLRLKRLSWRDISRPLLVVSGWLIIKAWLLAPRTALSSSGTWSRRRSYSSGVRSSAKSMRDTLMRSSAVLCPQMASISWVEVRTVLSVSGTFTTKSKFKLSSATRTQSPKLLSTRTTTNSTQFQMTGHWKFGTYAKCATWILTTGTTQTSSPLISTRRIEWLRVLWIVSASFGKLMRMLSYFTTQCTIRLTVSTC